MAATVVSCCCWRCWGGMVAGMLVVAAVLGSAVVEEREVSLGRRVLEVRTVKAVTDSHPKYVRRAMTFVQTGKIFMVKHLVFVT